MQDVVVAIIRRGDRFAFLQRAEGDIWTFPSGKVENGETLDAAVVREAHEETGLTISVTKEFGKRSIGENTLHYWLCDSISGDLRLAEPDKFKKAEWMTAAQILAIAGDKMFIPVAQYLKSCSNGPILPRYEM